MPEPLPESAILDTPIDAVSVGEGYHIHMWVRVPLGWKHPVTEPARDIPWPKDAFVYECVTCHETGYRIPAERADGVSHAV